MIRTPLRPLARILEARHKGENPDAIERENKRIRHEQMRDQDRVRAEGRLLVLGAFFFCLFAVVGARMGLMAMSEPVEPRAHAPGAVISASRADIVDRNGSILATNLETHALYAQPKHMIDPENAAEQLVAIFPDLKKERLIKDFTGKRKFLWIKKKISPEQLQAVHEIGDPGLLFAPRDMRLYPNGRLAAHVMGGASFGKEGVHAAEVIGVAGVEKYHDDYLRDPVNAGNPLELSLDLTVQAASERVLYGGMKLMNAKGATSVLMDVKTGEVISVVSLPTFDPNKRPRPAVEGDIMEFCKQFNARTQDKPGKVLPAVITVYSDKSFDFVIKTPPAAVQLLEAAKLKSGSAEPNRVKVGKVTWDQVKAIAEDKMPDLNCFVIESAMKMVAGTARSMGLTVQGTAPWNNN